MAWVKFKKINKPDLRYYRNILLKVGQVDSYNWWLRLPIFWWKWEIALN